MLGVTYLRSFIKITDFFAEDGLSIMDSHKNVDTDILISSWEREVPRQKGFFFVKSFKTLLIDLRKDKNQLFSEIHSNQRYKINRAATKDNLTYRQWDNPSDAQIENFCAFFDTFASFKNIKKSCPNKLKALRDKRALVISSISKEQGKELCYHAYIADGKRAALLYSASDRNRKDSAELNLIGRANRYLHWIDILFFKDKGFAWYDFLGITQNKNDVEGQNINRFKKGFGGFEVTEYRSYCAKSLAGICVILLFWLKWRKHSTLVKHPQFPGLYKIGGILMKPPK